MVAVIVSCSILERTDVERSLLNEGQNHKGWGQGAKLGKHSAICSKLGTALQAYTLNPCTKFAANPTFRKVNISALLEKVACMPRYILL